MRAFLVALLVLLNVWVWWHVVQPPPPPPNLLLPHTTYGANNSDVEKAIATNPTTLALPPKIADTLSPSHKDSTVFRHVPALPPQLPTVETLQPTANLDVYLSNLGLIDVKTTDSTLHIDLRYATSDNFLGQALYADLTACYVLPRTAKMLAKAQSQLHAVSPQYSLLLLDCARPRRVQQQLWQSVKNQPALRRYVAPPTSGSLHNFGAAVDVTLIDATGQALDMGTPYDFMGDLAQPRYHRRFLANGQLTPLQVNNRLLLRRVMREAGFKAIESEWWHFNACTIAEARQRYQRIE